MGVSFRATATIGYLVKDVTAVKHSAESKTKYDEDTGKPREVVVKKEHHFLFGREADFGEDGLSEKVYEWELEINGEDGEGGGGVIGLKLCDLDPDDNDDPFPVSQQKVNELRDELLGTLCRHGFDPITSGHGEPKLYFTAQHR